MSLIGTIMGIALLLAGLGLMIVGSLGSRLLPDFFSRTHAASKVDTVGIVVALIGIAFLGEGGVEGTKALLAAFLIMLTNPVSAHALAKAAFASGLEPWRRETADGKDKTGPSEG
jgi:multicomponent Na+:H+ antiporter subunit G